MIVLIDNYDSFTYNLYQLLSVGISKKIKVVRNDELSLKEIQKLKPTLLVISPGPGAPKDSGISKSAIRYFGERGIVVFGVCLGLQAMCEEYGGVVGYAKEILHGKSTKAEILCQTPLFNRIKDLNVGRYHSLAITKMPKDFIITSKSQGEIMAIEHKKYKIYGVQFHPESILTSYGLDIIKNLKQIIKDNNANHKRSY